jgi:alpha-galactosidase
MGMMTTAAEEAAVAVALTRALDRDGFPAREEWPAALPIAFDADWQGKNADPLRETEVRLLWSREALFLRFRCRYRELTTFSDSRPDGRRHGLWDRDVAEVFLQPDSSDPRCYWEFEISPNGKWIDLDIAPGEKVPGHQGNPRSGMKSRARIEEAQKIWTAEMALPMRSLTPDFDPAAVWRVNFFRVEGPAEPRFYSSWQPTKSPQPNFHVPGAFGKLSFR